MKEKEIWMKPGYETWPTNVHFKLGSYTYNNLYFAFALKFFEPYFDDIIEELLEREEY